MKIEKDDFIIARADINSQMFGSKNLKSFIKNKIYKIEDINIVKQYELVLRKIFYITTENNTLYIINDILVFFDCFDLIKKSLIIEKIDLN